MKASNILFWLSWLVLAVTAISLTYQQERERHKYARANVSDFMICTNPNVMGRLECLTLPKGSILLVPVKAQEGPQDAPAQAN